MLWFIIIAIIWLISYYYIRDVYERQRFEYKYPRFYYPGYVLGYGHVEPLVMNGKRVVGIKKVSHVVNEYVLENE